MHSSYRLKLADGFEVEIAAGDAGASKIVDLLAGAMMLEPGTAKYSLLVLTGQKSETFSSDGKRIVCGFPLQTNQDDIAIQAMQVGLAIAHQVQKRGGVLVHGGLAEFQEKGVILAAPGGTGNTTKPVPLKAIYFLSRSPVDDLDDLNSSQAAAMLIESVEQANRTFDKTLSPSDIHENHRRQFSIVCERADRLPMHRLQLSLSGNFWDLVEESLKHPRTVLEVSSFEENEKSEVSSDKKSTPSEVVLSGTSMYPTLKAPGFLEVRPYGKAKPRRGDVICFRAPGSGKMVIHRVMAVRPEGLITRGDNISHNDPDVVTLCAVVGRVDAIRKGGDGILRVRGGRAGMLEYAYARLFRMTRMLVGRMCRLILSPNFLLGCLRLFAPRSTRFKFVYFGSMPQGQLKILLGNDCIGHYLRGIWHIAFPWRFWVDPAEIQSASQKIESAEAQWLKTYMKEWDATVDSRGV
jgi:hypothetical protein